jgi:hypothetical protein
MSGIPIEIKAFVGTVIGLGVAACTARAWFVLISRCAVVLGVLQHDVRLRRNSTMDETGHIGDIEFGPEELECLQIPQSKPEVGYSI